MNHPEKFDESLTQLWKTQEVDQMDITLNIVKAKANKLEKNVRWRNISEWLACAILVPFFGWVALTVPNFLVQLGALELVLAACYVAYRFYRNGRTRQPPDPALDTVAYLRAYQRELLHQAALLQQVPVWYVGPLGLGVFIILAGSILGAIQAGHPVTGWLVSLLLIFLGAVILFMVGVAYLNRRAARQLRQEAATLDTGRE